MSAGKMKRRGFLKGAAGAAAGMVAAPYVITSSALGAGGRAPASERVTLGHIGVGGRGGSLMGAFPGSQSVAASDPFKSRREAAAAHCGGKAYRDFRRLLARDDIDAVVVATPDHWHVPIAIAAAKAGKDMYVEKPLGVSIAEDQACGEAVKQYGRVFQYGTQQRSSAHCRFGCELVRNGRIGEIREVHVTAPDGAAGGSTEPIPVPEDLDYDLWLGPAPWRPYTKDRCTHLGTYHVYDNSIGFIGGWGAHPLDILQWGFDTHLAGMIECEGTGTIPTEGLFDTVVHWDVRIQFGNGVKMTFKPGGDCTTFVGTQGRVSVARGRIDADPKSLLQSTIGPEELHLQESRHHGANFVEAVKNRTTPVSNIDDAVWSDLISHLSDIAIRTGRKIKWNPKTETIVGDEEASRMLNRAMREPWRL
ncbi:MAG TPA: Gfo/Idh/MocA family oxidoreductase [Phycisphaerae bacterium]|nr:Gfo/Idh/MocA family oxidoreductase [Phycisphaerae bacterium]